MSAHNWKYWIQNNRNNNEGQGGDPIKPLWTLPLEDENAEERILDWHTTVRDTLENHHNARTAMYVRNQDLYTGCHANARGRVGTVSDPAGNWGKAAFKVPEIIVNHSYELTEQWVGKKSRFTPVVEILPANTEESDRNKARASQHFADHIREKHNFQQLFIDCIRDSHMGGESYIVVDWDESAGDLHPDQKKAKEKNIRVPLMSEETDENGKRIQAASEQGDLLFIEKVQRVGELTYRIRSVPEVIIQPKKRWKDVEWFCEIDLVDIDDLKRDYPDKIGVIDTGAATRAKPNDSTGSIDSGNSVFVYTYWHKRVDAMDKGRRIVCLDDAVLLNEENPFSGAPLPIVRLTDIDVPGQLHGVSFLNNIVIPQLALNKLYTLFYKNIAQASHPYWMINRNARVNTKQIRNSQSIIMYSGQSAPRLEIFKTVGGELLQLIEKLEQRMMTISRIQSTSRGELPPNVEAGVAIGILEEQENQAATPDIKKINAGVEKLYTLSLGIAGDKYEKNDGRTARILGKEGEFLLEELDTAKLSGPYDVRTKKATALSQSKPLMIQQITQLESMRPGTFSKEALYDSLELGDRDKFYDIITASRRTAALENEKMRSGEQVPEATSSEQLLVHYDAHLQEMQTPTYVLKTSEEVRTLFQDHLIGTEMLLMERAKVNISLATELANREYFPVFYQPDVTLPQILMAHQQGQAVPLLGETDQAEVGEVSALPTDLVNDQGGGEEIPIEGLANETDQIPVEGELNGTDPAGQVG